MSDWEDLKADRWWSPLISGDGEILEEFAAVSWQPPSTQFAATFPILTDLLGRARLTKVRLSGDGYQLFGWTKANGDTLGWVCPLPGRQLDKELHEVHTLLLSGVGGVAECWNGPCDNWLENQNSALTESESRVSGCEWDESYRHICGLDNLEPVIDCTDYTSFAFEANGNFTSYHRTTSAVLMYAHDHSFDHIAPYEGCPEYTWNRINDCPDLKTWVETLANQWLNAILNSSPDELPPAPNESASTKKVHTGLVLLAECDPPPAPGTILYASNGEQRYVFLESGEHSFPAERAYGIHLHEIDNPDEAYWTWYEQISKRLYVRTDS